MTRGKKLLSHYFSDLLIWFTILIGIHRLLVICFKTNFKLINLKYVIVTIGLHVKSRSSSYIKTQQKLHIYLSCRYLHTFLTSLKMSAIKLPVSLIKS